ncbi:MAG: tRNA 4-thiouridine(8) synthase ThiI [Kiritimatiellaeota bacterium]|nr:tRNA 4-thiouridine(8) synthase ThiI [Kiritimatiellota bacterium]
MSENQRPGRGLSLLSGGLDSQLAVCVLREQGLYVEGVVFASPFFKIDAARRAAEHLGLPLHVVPFTRDILELVESPRHGFGGAMNPCIDCHARMIRRAGEMMAEKGFDFVATGEVLNQRPMSQTRKSLAQVAADAGLGGRLLRPLCARHLEPTLPETEGIVDRERLLDLHGRSRKPQMELAKRFGLLEYPSPAGGCLLTEKGFCRKLADLKAHEGFGDERLAWLLLYGRHFRLPGGAKCIVGRDARDNAKLKEMRRDGDVLLHTVNVPGPTALLLGGAGDGDIAHAASICATYGDRDGRPDAVVRIHASGAATEASAPALPREQLETL